MQAFRLFVATMVVFSVSSFGIFDPSWERPILEAELSSSQAGFPRAQSLTLHKRDGAKRDTLFSLVEDTGIVCITTPCPSEITVLFEIKNIQRIDRLTTRYTAVELPRVTETGSVVNGLRTLTVVDFAGFRQQWNVTLKDAEGRRQSYVGYPQGIATIESAEVTE